MDLQLTDKVIVVTGGDKGIGRAIAQTLAQEGALPFIISRKEKDCQSCIAAIESEGGRADYAIAELTDLTQCKDAIEKLMQRHGRIDGVVNNAGVNDGVSLKQGCYTEFLSSIEKNVGHYFNMVQLCLEGLKTSKGAIVNISSKVAETGQGGTSGYAAANGARNALTREWAVDLLQDDIRVNAVVVAESYTPLYQRWIESFENPELKKNEIESKIPLGQRMTTPEEIASTVCFLLSSRSSHTTGQIIHVDGGYTHLDRSI
ncbi:MAG: SDR family oxidoreductase [Flavobacteriaceae bacterium]|nr:SDR family oxidoreductase [Flavobacteriaceae bacterium]